MPTSASSSASTIGANIYRVLGVDEAIGVSNNEVGIVMAPLGPATVSDIAQVQSTVRIQGQRSLITVNNEAAIGPAVYVGLLVVCRNRRDTVTVNSA